MSQTPLLSLLHQVPNVSVQIPHHSPVFWKLQTLRIYKFCKPSMTVTFYKRGSDFPPLDVAQGPSPPRGMPVTVEPHFVGRHWALVACGGLNPNVFCKSLAKPSVSPLPVYNPSTLLFSRSHSPCPRLCPPFPSHHSLLAPSTAAAPRPNPPPPRHVPPPHISVRVGFDPIAPPHAANESQRTRTVR